MKQVIPGDFKLFESTEKNSLTFISDSLESNQNKKSSIIKIQILDHHLIRVTHIPPNKDREISNSTPTLSIYNNKNKHCYGLNRNELHHSFPCPNSTFTDESSLDNSLQSYTISTKLMKVKCVISNGDLTLKWFNIAEDSNDIFQEDLPNRSYAFNADNGVYHYVKKKSSNQHFGLGEHTGNILLNDRRFQIASTDALGYNSETTDPLYKVCPFYLTLTPDIKLKNGVSPFAYGVFYDNMSTGWMNFGKEIDAFWGQYTYYKSDFGILDYYIISGSPDNTNSTTMNDSSICIQNVIQRFSQLIGRPALIPRFGLGYLASAMGYAESENAQELLEDFVDKCIQYDIPCDLIHLSSGYTVSEENGSRNVFTWNKSRFPNPKSMIEEYHNAGIKIAANVKPWHLKSHPNYNEGVIDQGYILDHESKTPRLTRLWKGGAGSTESGSYFDFTSTGGRKIWKAGIKNLLELGIDGIWNDNNEFSLPHDDDIYSMSVFEENAANNQSIPNITPSTVGVSGTSLQVLMMATASYEAMNEANPKSRPFLITRSGCPGIQKYAVQTWSGDNFSSWHTLKYNIGIGLSTSISCVMPGYGHDVGGFYGPRPSKELFIRWVQNGIYHPRFSIHSWKDEGANEPWMYPEAVDIIRDAIKLRYQMIPYLYNLYYEAHKTGAPIIRPLLYHFANDEKCLTNSCEFMLGPHLLVASVFTENETIRSVYLPRGRINEQWCDIWTGKWYVADGVNEIKVNVPIHQHGALFARGGSIIPLSPRLKDVSKMKVSGLMNYNSSRLVWIFPENTKGSSEYQFVEDDGESSDTSKVTIMKVWMKYDEEKVMVDVEIIQNSFKIGYDKIGFLLPINDSRSIIIQSPKYGGEFQQEDGRVVHFVKL